MFPRKPEQAVAELRKGYYLKEGHVGQVRNANASTVQNHTELGRNGAAALTHLEDSHNGCPTQMRLKSKGAPSLEL
jgi:hypothetical protein